MSGLLPPMLRLLPVAPLRGRGRRLQLEHAERAIDGVFSRQASLKIDRCVVAFEQARRHEAPRRRAA